MTSTKRKFQDFRGLDFNDPDNRLQSPSAPTGDIVKSLFQVHRAVADFLLLKDLLSLFSKLERMFVEVYLRPMKEQLFIKTELAHQILVQELDYIRESTRQLFAEKLSLDFKLLDSVCKEIESEKTVYLMP